MTSLRTHMASMHSARTAQAVCEICAKSFSSKNKLSYHRTKHFEQEKVECKLCNKWLVKATFFLLNFHF